MDWFRKGSSGRDGRNDSSENPLSCPQHVATLHTTAGPLRVEVPITTGVIIEWIQSCPNVDVLDCVAGAALRRAIKLRKDS